MKLKYIFTIFCITCHLRSFSQQEEKIDKDLSQAFAKIEYWSVYDSKNDEIDRYDSLEKANTTFEKLLLKYTTSNSKTLSYTFHKLSSSGLIIRTSEDGLFRIYSWNTNTGGTMRFYRTIFQYKNKKGTYSMPSVYNSRRDPPDPTCFYHQINKVISQKKTFYITQSTSVLSSAYTAHFIKIFSIEDYGLNDTAKLIKTKTGIRNELGYEMDFSTSSNKNTTRGDINYSTEYDPTTKTITIPLIEEDGKLTARKIRYRFDGKYFVKM